MGKTHIGGAVKAGGRRLDAGGERHIARGILGGVMRGGADGESGVGKAGRREARVCRVRVGCHRP